MATSTVPIAVAIMAHRTLREASGAAMPLAVFTSDLTRLLWANTSAAQLLGLSSPGPQSPDATPNTTIIRQIRASGRMLARTGSAKARVTSPARTGLGRPLNAELAPIADGAFGDAVLVTIEDPDAEALNDAESARRLLAETGMGEGTVFGADGRVAATGHDGQDLSCDPSQIADFIASRHDHRTMAMDDGSRTMLARLAGDRVLGWTVRPQAPAPRQETDDQQSEADSEAPASAGHGDNYDRKIGMSAILQRWYFRNTGAAAAERTEAAEHSESLGESASMPPRDDRAADPAETPSPGPRQPYGARTGHAGSVERPAGARTMRSNWGAEATPAPASDGEMAPAEPDATREIGPEQPLAEEQAAPAADVSSVAGAPEDGADDEDAASDEAAANPPVAGGVRPVLPSDFRSFPDTREDTVPDMSAPGTPAVAAMTDSDFTPRFDVAPVRFVWRIDNEGRFRSLSPEFAAAVGPRFADVIDRRFEDVAEAYGLDADGDIRRLLAKRDTWSGRTLEWPVENSTRRVPVELAALPVYARDRSFDGFRGFGIVRLGDAVEAPAMAAQEAVSDETADAQELTLEGGARALLKRISAEEPQLPFGRRDPDDRPDPDKGDRAEKIIRLEERRRPKDSHLSQAEEAAFRAIGETLGDEERVGGLEGAIRNASRRIGEIEDEAGARDAADTGSEAAVAPATDDRAAAIAADAPAPDNADLPDPQAADSDLPDAPSTETARGIAPAEQPSPRDRVAQAGSEEDVPAPDTATATAMGDDLSNQKDSDGDPSAGSGESDDADMTDDDDSADEPELPDHAQLLAELTTVYGCLPLPVLVQVRETLVYGNREFFDLTGYDDIAALSDAGGLARLFDGDDRTAGSGEVAIRRVTGETLSARSHMQRSTIAGRSCLVMSFFASPSLSAAALRHELEDVPPPADAEADIGVVAELEELQAVLAAATDGVVLVDRDGMIRSMNRAAHRLFGIGRDDAGGRPFVTLLAHESQKPTLEHIEALRTTGAPAPRDDGREVIGRVAEGGFVPLSVSFGPLPDDRGWCAVIRDISRAKRVEQELIKARSEAEAASLQKSQFLANVSHELRTPLNAIIGFADVIATECFGPIGNERYLEYLDDIKRSGHHVLDLVNDLLDISKIEAGKLDLAFEAVSLNEVIAEVVALMQPQANREQVIVRSNLPSSVPPVVADRRSMRQIALNLVSNAVRFTPAGGQIIVSTSYSPEGDVVVRFRDSGIGMSEDEIEIAMMPFQQVNPGNRRRGEGTGLGLPLTKALTEANRAGFAMSSTPGEGTLVEISFPPQRVLTD
ncbi:PAS domain S-box protein [Aurantimonas sp. A2-1-M11]|uniref:PAS domain S-box protein n=1 Tax=Aurantimonas sp. A2-1-M11 TaxID=3113712 RepID=UPI002F949AFD